MGREIERKFLLRDDGWRSEAQGWQDMRQGYLTRNGRSSVRVRRAGDQAFLNIKSAELGVERLEFEYPIPVADADEILARLCDGPLVEKRRYRVPVGRHVWEIDEFSGANRGLIVAEVELGQPDEGFERPAWLGREVSHEARYYNVCLARYPYCQWAEEERRG